MSPRSGPAMLHRVGSMRQAKERMVLSFYQRPVNAAIKASSLGGIESLKLERKGFCEVHTSQCCLEAELKRKAKVQAVFPANLDMGLSKISLILVSNSCYSTTGITPPSESCTEAMVSTRAVVV